MLRKRISAGIGTAALVISAAMLGAPAAAAAELGPTTVACAVGPSETLDISGVVGDTLTITSTSSSNCYPTTSTPGVVSWVSDDPANPGVDPGTVYGWTDYSNWPFSGTGTTITVTLIGAGTTTWIAQQNGQGITVNFTVASGSASRTPSPDWVQGYARGSADVACDEGWSPSWEFWANDGNGGFVCTRSVPEYGSN